MLRFEGRRLGLTQQGFERQPTHGWSGPGRPRAARLLPVVVALFVPLVAYVASERIPTQSELAKLEFPSSALRGDRAHRLQVPVREAKPLTRRVLFVVLDNWRRQVALNDSSTPRLAALARFGSRGIVLTGVRTYTKACMRILLTGVNSNLRDSALELLSDPVTEESLLSRLNAAGYPYTLIDATPAFPGLFKQQCRPGSLVTPSVAGLPWDPEDPAHDAPVEAATLRALENPELKFIMIHLEDLDLASHLYTPISAAYERVVKKTDSRMARITAQLDFDRDTLFVIGDHGSDDRGHHGGPEYAARETAYLAAGPGISRANRPLDPLDVADSLAMLLGLCPPLDSMGAPNPQLLAIDPRELKQRCDQCLRDRLATLPGPGSRWTSTVEAKQYFTATEFTPRVAELYKRVTSPLPETRRSWRVAVAGLAAVAVSFLALLVFGIDSRVGVGWLAALAALAFLPFRDGVAVVVFAAIFAIISLNHLRTAAAAGRRRSMRRSDWAGCAAASALLLSLVLANPTPFFHSVESIAGSVALALGGCFLAPQIFERSRAGRFTPVLLLGLAASVAATLLSGHRLSGMYSISVWLVDFALGIGGLFLILGLVLREDGLVGLASIVLAGCVFRGWPLLIVMLLEIFLRCLRTSVPRSLTDAIVWAPVGVLALFHAANGGYGFAKIDVSLAVVGSEVDTVDFRWAAGMILLAYILPFLLSVRVALAITKHSLRVNLNVLLSVFVMCAGADLIFLALPGFQGLRAGKYEEMVSFDIGLAALAVAFQIARMGWSLARGTRQEVGRPLPLMD
ncbi:MAG: alkaline phosphatase family protein [Acidobacteriota bacterium]